MSIAARPVLAQATATLRAAGVESPEQDARLLLAHVCGIEPLRLPLLDEIDDDQATRFQKLIMDRARRVPLQHLTGRAYFRYLQLEVGPGVFVPRPETEVMTGWAIDQLRPMIMNKKMPLVVELCTGSGAIAKAIATELTGAVVHAVELSEEAAGYAARNLADVPVWLHVGDMADALHELDGTVDLVIANPPYIPLEAYESVALEARDHDPSLALFSGPTAWTRSEPWSGRGSAAPPGRPVVLRARRPARGVGTGRRPGDRGLRRRTRQPRSGRSAAVRHGRPQRLTLARWAR